MHIVRIVKHATLLAIAISALVTLSPLCSSAEARKHRSSGASSRQASSSRHHSSHSTRRGHHKAAAAAKPRYAYPIDIFMMQAPEQDLSLLAQDEALKVRYAFQSGHADNYPPSFLVRSGAVNYFPLHGGIFSRREEVKYVIVHSTETGVPQDARHVINSWSSGGRRHPGAQYVVDRDGTIFECVDPKYATVHVNIFKTLPGINNDNSVGIEMCHAGSQDYPQEQRASVIRLLSYLQDRFHVVNDNVITHRYAQQGDHTDPVAFNFDEFLARKDDFHNRALAMKRPEPVIEDMAAAEIDAPPAAVYLEMHRDIAAPPPQASQRSPSLPELQQQLGTAQHVFTAPKQPVDLSKGSMLQSAAPRHNASLRGEIELPPDTASQVSNP